MICYCALKPEAFSFTEREGRGERRRGEIEFGV
jgi:hypothetical protein